MTLHPWTKMVPGAVDGCSLWCYTGWKCAYGTTPLSLSRHCEPDFDARGSAVD